MCYMDVDNPPTAVELAHSNNYNLQTKSQLISPYSSWVQRKYRWNTKDEGIVSYRGKEMLRKE